MGELTFPNLSPEIIRQKLKALKKKRKRTYRATAVRWEANPFEELAKIRAKENGITISEAKDLLRLEHELAKIKA